MIVITAPTSQIGRQILDSVLDSGESIRVIARDPSRLGPQARERVEVIHGSHADPDVVAKAFAGADSVFWLVPPNPHAESVEGYLLDFTRPACEAIKSQGVKRVVGVSTLGRGVANNAGQVSAALAVDELIESTGVNYRALRMPGFMENMLQQIGPIKTQGMFFQTVPGDLKLPTCATRDIAAVAARLLLDDSWSGQDGVPVLGPEDLSPKDMAQIMSEMLQRPVRFQQVPSETYKATLMRHGMTEAWAQGLVDMANQVEQGIYNTEPRTPRSTTPTSFRQWCEEVLKPAVLD
ncbi:NmrA family NAD(P)-binding protein [Streptosporangium subroseum]|uniref:NmrA family NAD(P)-binding protein n=1 Tax=Streptosporangium subroseum TaxID=106412 RepID=UPI00308713EC|nr:NAD(P)H-binding protein [Streptosporangium subroseum]